MLSCSAASTGSPNSGPHRDTLYIHVYFVPLVCFPVYICFIPEYTFSHVCSIPKCAFSRYSPPSEEINCTPNKTYIDHLLTGMLCKCVDSVRSPGCRQNPCGWTRLTSLCPLPCLNPHIWTTLLFLRKWGCPGQMVLVYSADVRVSPLSLSLFPHSYC